MQLQCPSLAQEVRRLSALVGALALLLSAAAAAEVTPALAHGHLAVLDFKNKLNEKDRVEVDATYFADSVRSAALRSVPTLKVITRENLLVLLQSTGKKLDECEGECEVDTGRRIGAELVISGDLLKIGTRFKLNLRLHETAGGELISGAVANGGSVDELDERTNAAIVDLLAPIVRAAAEAPAAQSAGAARSAPPTPPLAPPPPAARVEESPASAPKVASATSPRELPAEPTAAPAASGPPAPAQSIRSPAGSGERTPALRKVAWGLFGAGALLGGGAAVFALRGKSLINQVKNGGLATAADIQKAASDSEATNGPAKILAIGGGAVILGGVVALLLSSSSGPEAAVAVGLSADSLLLAGRF
jgi:TolB-like protein